MSQSFHGVEDTNSVINKIQEVMKSMQDDGF